MSFRSDSTGGPDSNEKEGPEVLVDDVKEEWRLLWRDRIDDKVRAEGIANRDYSLLFVERGTVIVATRDFKPLNLKEILRSHEIQNPNCFIPPHPSMGGWGKFARAVLNKLKRARKWEKTALRRSRIKNLQLKKGGRGWLHYRMKK